MCMNVYRKFIVRCLEDKEDSFLYTVDFGIGSQVISFCHLESKLFMSK